MSRSHSGGDAGIIPHMLNTEILQRIEKRMAALDLSPRAISIAAGLGPDAIRDLKRRPDVLPRLDSLSALAEVLQTTPEWLAFGVESLAPERHTMTPVPLVSWVAASSYAEAPDALAHEDHEIVPCPDLPHGRYIALRVQGDSMDRIAPDKSIAIVRTSERQLIPRQFYVFASPQGATFKRYMVGPERLAPYSTNADHDALELVPELRVVGRVVRIITDL